MYDVAIEILKKLDNMGYESYIIGGYVRDKLVNIVNNDIDICTSAKPDVIKEIFDIIEDNSQFGSLKVKYKDYIFEITTFRIEINYKGRYPDVIFTDNLSDDLKRRDFTINTICIDSNGEYVDLLGGINDLDNKLIKSIGDCEQKFKEDPLRILRAIRFMGKLNFKLDVELEDNIHKYSYLLNDISKTKVKKEIDMMNEISKEKLKELNIEV